MIVDNKSINNVMRKSKTNFFYSSFFLSNVKKEGLKVIYAFCRKTDDIVDNNLISKDEKISTLNNWKNELTNAFRNNSQSEFMNKVVEVVRRFNIQDKYLYELIEGMEMDIHKNRYATFEELYGYCYKVASCVGLMTIEIFGYRNPLIRDYAVNLGIALQLTNIIRDVKKDALMDRIYIPTEDLKKFNYSEQELKSSYYNNNFFRLMLFESKRTEEFYETASSFFDINEAQNLISAKIMQDIYFKILKKIELTKYDVYNKTVHLSKITKLYTAFRVFVKYKQL